MTSRDFCYWLQGALEISGPAELNAAQLEIVKRHLALVFSHEIDPSFGPQSAQKKLNEIHAGSAIGGTIGDGIKYRC